VPEIPVDSNALDINSTKEAAASGDNRQEGEIKAHGSATKEWAIFFLSTWGSPTAVASPTHRIRIAYAIFTV